MATYAMPFAFRRYLLAAPQFSMGFRAGPTGCDFGLYDVISHFMGGRIYARRLSSFCASASFARALLRQHATRYLRASRLSVELPAYDAASARWHADDDFVTIADAARAISEADRIEAGRLSIPIPATLPCR